MLPLAVLDRGFNGVSGCPIWQRDEGACKYRGVYFDELSVLSSLVQTSRHR